ncbi:MAG TPA: hypothetical protein VMD09_13250 [Solirubrobacteraceae bacterium]|nr:hypothetical protein [Solirubrobacteraceae bacterium]
MAKKQEKDLLKTLRAGGVRKKVARAVTEATEGAKRGKQPALVTKALDDLKTATGELEKRVRGSERSEAAKKAARTRKRKAAERSAAARKGARTRAKTRS